MDEAQHFREILHRMTSRYMTVGPQGVVLDFQHLPVPLLDARILGHGAARTLYRGRKPFCRSLDAMHSVTHTSRSCPSCPDRKHCTQQVRVDLLYQGAPYKLLLAFTSAKNFLFHVAELTRKAQPTLGARVRITVINKGSWGEVRFADPDATPPPRSAGPLSQQPWDGMTI